ncbi:MULTISPECIES: Cro/CI family transcriptional regulator [Rahnella]|jgi:hypothetical protein|uniref:Cro/CI family transcriptional regulator n=1 Tax=Rahnella sp. (strain Y9602) TaxID=2703885 RepID=A0ABW6CHJ6_RAHSY|nr:MULTISPECIES: Cro/CI family transcriptional regulator [Rahnella]NIA89972.1 cell division protein [Rahnella aceris]CAH0237311.1 hypothetical protein SRABI106_02320 [Rahnella aquatilis]
MTTSDLEKYFGEPGKVAEFFGISPEAFYLWRKRPGQLIPKGRAAEAAYRTKGELKYDPTLYKKAITSGEQP